MLYKIQKKDINGAARLLGKSFRDYPVFKYVLPDYAYRCKKLHHLFRFIIKMGMQNGDVIAPSNKIEGISIWIDSYSTTPSLATVIKSGFIKLVFETNLNTIKRFLEVGKKKEVIRADLVAQPYCLLDVIGVAARSQKKGLARVMIETKLAEFDQRQMPCYLETSDHANIAFYRIFGFDLIHEYRLMAVKSFCLYRTPSYG